MITPQTLAALENAPLSVIRRHVRTTLEQTGSFHELAPGEQRKVAHDLVRVLTYLSDPYGGQPAPVNAAAPAPAPVRAAAPARGLAEPEKPPSAVDEYKKLGDKSTVGQTFTAGANTAGAQTFKDLVGAVDFPGFVSSLIEGVFTSIVNTSIKQMHEFGKFLEGVVKSVNEFAQEHVSPDEGRDYLRGKHPAAFKQEPGPLQFNDDLEDSQMPDFKALFGMDEQPDLGDEEVEKRVAQSAQLQLAKMRQQQLSTMMLLGINRIVVTEGEIKASVQFDVSATDRARSTTNTNFDDTASHNDARSDYSYGRSSSVWGTSRGGSGSSGSEVNTRVTTSHADTKNDSDSKVESKAKMTGFVQVKFKSETFPLERMASQVEMGAIQEKSKR